MNNNNEFDLTEIKMFMFLWPCSLMPNKFWFSLWVIYSVKVLGKLRDEQKPKNAICSQKIPTSLIFSVICFSLQPQY